jgi:tetratricopeptide (TPR) repeat protein
LASEPERTKLLINRANVLELAFDFQGAIATLRDLSASDSREGEPRVSWLIKFTLVNNLLQAGSPEEANTLIPKMRQLAARLDNDLDFVRLRWLEGRVAAAMGRRTEALQSLSRVRDDLATRKIPYDTAMVSVELSVLLLEDGRTSEVRTIARQILWILRSQGVHREALAALRLFCEAAEQETATLAMAKRLSEYLQRARNEPGLRFEDS